MGQTVKSDDLSGDMHGAAGQFAGAPIVEMSGIRKSYGSTLAVDGVSFQATSGEIHALLGENGAGKTTLMQILAGLTSADAGGIRIGGIPVTIRSPRDAARLGIAMVHQHFTLVPAFTVAENLALDRIPSRSINPLRSYVAAREAEPALERASKLGWTLDPTAKAGQLPVGIQQRIEIARALATNARILIFDEPTAVLTASEVDDLFDVLRMLKSQGNAVILIAHKLSEILAVADRVTVLRRGIRVAVAPAADVNAAKLAIWMVGEALPEAPTEDESERNVVAAPPHGGIEVRDLRVLGDRGEQAVSGIDLNVHRGEVFGIGGVDGNGQTELAETMAGIRTPSGGTIRWDGAPFHPSGPPTPGGAASAATIGYVPQDRRAAGLAVGLSIEENLLFDAVREPAYRRGPFLRRSALRRLAEDLACEYDIRTPDVGLPASSLSGGNQQKIVAARALRSDPEWIVAVNPTRGLDIGATRFVHQELRKARARGAAVLLISTDLDEIAVLADRAAIISGGGLSSFDPKSYSAEELGLLLGGEASRSPLPAASGAKTQFGNQTGDPK